MKLNGQQSMHCHCKIERLIFCLYISDYKDTKGGCPKKKTSKMWTFGKKPLPYLPHIQIWTTKVWTIFLVYTLPPSSKSLDEVMKKFMSKIMSPCYIW